MLNNSSHWKIEVVNYANEISIHNLIVLFKISFFILFFFWNFDTSTKMLKKENIAFFNDKNKMKILCFNLTNCSRSTQFVLLSLSVFFFHCFQGYMHELIFRLPGFKPFSIFFTLLQFAIYASLGVIESIFKNGFRFYKTRKYFKTFTCYCFNSN